MTVSMVQIELVPTTVEHIRELARNIRPEDAREALGLGVPPLKALIRMRRKALICRTCLLDGEVAAIYGLLGSLLGLVGWPFFVTSKSVSKISPLVFTRIYKQEFESFKAIHPLLEIFVDCNYKGALRLLKLVGFKWNPELKIKGHDEVEFYHVTYKSEDI